MLEMVGTLVDAVAVVCLLGGCALATVGLVGLILKPNLFDQLHVAGLVTGPGVVLVLLASVGTGRAEIVTSAVLVVAFVLVTSSISTHLIAHAGVRRYGPAAAGAAAGPAAGAAGSGGPLARAADEAVERSPANGMRVVLAYDGSAGAELASGLAAAIDWPAGTVVRVVGAVDGFRAADAEAADPEATIPADDDGGRALRRAAELVARPGIQVETAIVAGDPADVVVEETAAFDADLLITGSRRRSFVQALLGWSAAGEIVDRAPCPVLVARSAQLRSVLLTTDGSPQSAVAADLVARWPIFDLTRVHVVTVSDGAAAHQRTAALVAAALMDAGREVVTEVLTGTPGPAIVDAARRRDVDLIVVGSRGRTGLGRTLLGSVAGDVLASAGCSVLIVGPRPRRPGPGAAPGGTR